MVPGVASAGCTRHAHLGRQDNEWKKEEDNHRKKAGKRAREKSNSHMAPLIGEPATVCDCFC